jgi:hypothetical protein
VTFSYLFAGKELEEKARIAKLLLFENMSTYALNSHDTSSIPNQSIAQLHTSLPNTLISVLFRLLFKSHSSTVKTGQWLKQTN